MATNATWTVVLEDKMVIKNHAEGADEGLGYVIVDNDFWGLAKWNNITPHSTWENANLGDFQDFITRWDSAHLAQLQANWDNDPREESEKGARPTSYSS